jgi:hypothetical protein
MYLPINVTQLSGRKPEQGSARAMPNHPKKGSIQASWHH